MSDERWSEWIEWKGGECPLPKGTICDVRLRRGDVLVGVKANIATGGSPSAHQAYWDKDNLGSDIIAYRYNLQKETLTPEQEADAHKEQGLMTLEERELPAREHQYSPYFKDVRHIDTLDVYRVLDLFEVEKHGHPISHAAKKLLLSGVRTGGKDVEADIREAIDSLMRWLEMREEDNGKV